jgi:hypothetical protein
VPSVSWDGEHNDTAIVWASHPTDDDATNKTIDGTLRAFDARDLNRELWNSAMDAEGADRVGSFAKFCPPVVANGKVYLSTFRVNLPFMGCFRKLASRNIRMRSAFSSSARLEQLFSSPARIRPLGMIFGSPAMESASRTVSCLLTWIVIPIMNP